MRVAIPAPGEGTTEAILATYAIMAASRPLYKVVDGHQLMEAWSPWLKLRQPGWAWGGSEYRRPHRNQAADVGGLELYKRPLLKLLELAPSGFPTHTSMREALLLCDDRFAILALADSSRLERAAVAADVWRKMAKDVYNMAKAGTHGAHPPMLKDMVDMIDLSHREGSSPHSSRSGAAAPALPDFASFAESECEDEALVVLLSDDDDYDDNAKGCPRQARR